MAVVGRDEDDVGRELVRRGTVRATDLARQLASLHGLDFVDLRQVVPAIEAIALLDERVARRLGALPLEISDDGLLVAVCATAAASLDAVRSAVGRPCTLALAAEDDLRAGIDRAFRADVEIARLAYAFDPADQQRSTLVELVDDRRGAGRADGQPGIAQGLRDRASDVHVEPMNEQIRIRFRIDGTLVDVMTLPIGIHPALVSRLKILADMNIVERRRPRTASSRPDRRRQGPRRPHVDPCRRCSARRSCATARQEPIADQPRPTRDAPRHRRRVLPHGSTRRSAWCICAGPTGAGKTTTLYATLQEINSTGKNIMTIEDPVEYVFPGINQIQTNEQAGLTFASGLRPSSARTPT